MQAIEVLNQASESIGVMLTTVSILALSAMIATIYLLFTSLNK